MTTSIDINETDTVLMDFAHAIEGKNSSATLAEYASRYPNLARDFGRIAEANWAKQNGLTEDHSLSMPADATLGARFREIGLAALHARPALATAPATAPLQSLLDAAKARGLSRQDFAARLQLPDTLLLKLHRRLIDAASIPNELVGKIADAIGRTNDEIAAYLKQPAQMPLGASFRSDSTPQAQTETFANALQSDPDAMPEHKAAWIDGGPRTVSSDGGSNESDHAA